MKESEGIRWLIVSIVFVIILIIFFALFIKYTDLILGEEKNVNGVVSLVNEPSEIFNQENYDRDNCTMYKYNFPYKIPDNIVNSNIIKYNATNNKNLIDNIDKNRTLISLNGKINTAGDDYYIYGPFNILTKRSYKCLQDNCVGYDGKEYVKNDTFEVYSKCTSLKSSATNKYKAIDLTINSLDPNSGNLIGGRICFVSIGGQEYTGTIETDKYYIDYYGDYDSMGNLLNTADKNYRLLTASASIGIKTSNLGGITNTGINDNTNMFYVIRGEIKTDSSGNKIFNPDTSSYTARIVKFVGANGFTQPRYLGFANEGGIQENEKVTLIDQKDIQSSLVDWQLIPSFGLSSVQINYATSVVSGNSKPCESIVNQYSYQLIAMPKTDNPIFFNDYSSFIGSPFEYFYMKPKDYDFSVQSEIFLQQLDWVEAPGYINPITDNSGTNFKSTTTCEFKLQEGVKQQQFIFHDNIDVYNILYDNPLIQPFGIWNPNS